MREVTIKCDQCKKELASGPHPAVYEQNLSSLFQVKASARTGRDAEEPIAAEMDVCTACLTSTVTTLADRVAAETGKVRGKVPEGQPFMVVLSITGWGTNADMPAPRAPVMQQ